MARQKASQMNVAVFDVEPEMEKYFRAHLPASQFSMHFVRRPLREQDAPALCDTAILVVFVHTRITAKLIQRLPSLRLIATCSTGYDHIDLAACAKQKITVVNVPSYGENTVAEFTFALLLCVMRKICEAAARMRGGSLSVQNLRGFDLAGKTIGVIGCGKIGLNVIRIANGFGMRVLAYDPFQKATILKKNGAVPVNLQRLVKTSAVITLHAPLNAKTKHLLNAARFRQMQRGVVIINTARGGLIDTDALCRALQRGTVRYAGLDVFEGEEVFAQEGRMAFSALSKRTTQTALEDHVLLHDNRVLITPHIAFNTHEAVERIYAATVNNILAFSRGQPVNLVSAER